MKITQEFLKEILNYDAITGVFTWLSTYRKTQIGTIAGCVHKQHTKSYHTICINYKKYPTHRLAWIYVYGSIPDDLEIDHINGNGLDNRISNLRCVNKSVNCKNLRIPSHNTSGISGVSMHKKTGKWRARIRNKGKYISLGLFVEKSDAAITIKNAREKYGYHINHGSDRPLY